MLTCSKIVHLTYLGYYCLVIYLIFENIDCLRSRKKCIFTMQIKKCATLKYFQGIIIRVSPGVSSFIQINPAITYRHVALPSDKHLHMQLIPSNDPSGLVPERPLVHTIFFHVCCKEWYKNYPCSLGQTPHFRTPRGTG